MQAAGASFWGTRPQCCPRTASWPRNGREYSTRVSQKQGPRVDPRPSGLRALNASPTNYGEGWSKRIQSPLRFNTVETAPGTEKRPRNMPFNATSASPTPGSSSATERTLDNGRKKKKPSGGFRSAEAGASAQAGAPRPRGGHGKRRLFGDIAISLLRHCLVFFCWNCHRCIDSTRSTGMRW